MKRSRQQRLAVLGVIMFGLIFGLIPSSTSFAQQEKYRIYLPLLAQPVPASSASGDFAQRVVELVNQKRTSNGCTPLAVNVALTSAALEHSTDMAVHDFFGHIGSDGSEPWDRMARAGYQWSMAAENIAAGYKSPESVVDGWMDSSEHRKYVLDCDLRDTGVGYYSLVNDTGSANYTDYWTQVFGTPP